MVCMYLACQSLLPPSSTHTHTHTHTHQSSVFSGSIAVARPNSSFVQHYELHNIAEGNVLGSHGVTPYIASIGLHPAFHGLQYNDEKLGGNALEWSASLPGGGTWVDKCSICLPPPIIPHTTDRESFSSDNTPELRSKLSPPNGPHLSPPSTPTVPCNGPHP